MEKLFPEPENVRCVWCLKTSILSSGTWISQCGHCKNVLLRNPPFGYKYVAPACCSFVLDLVPVDKRVYNCRLCSQEHYILKDSYDNIFGTNGKPVFKTEFDIHTGDNRKNNTFSIMQLAIIRIFQLEVEASYEITSKTELERVKRENEELKEMLETSEKENKSIKWELEMNEKLKEELLECRRMKEKLEEDLENSKKTMQASMEESVKIKEELEMTKKTSEEEMNESTNLLKDELKKANKENDELKKNLKDFKEVKEELEMTRKASEEVIKLLEEDLATLRLDYTNQWSIYETTKNELKKERDDLIHELAKEQEKNNELKEELEQKNEETRKMDELEEENQFLKDRLDVLQQFAKEKLNAFEIEKEEAMKASQENSAQLREANERIARLEMANKEKVDQIKFFQEEFRKMSTALVQVTSSCRKDVMAPRDDEMVAEQTSTQ